MCHDIAGSNAKEDWDRHWSAISAIEELVPGTYFRKRLMLELLRKFSRNAEIIADFGCGCGSFLHYLHEVGTKALLVGFDQSEEGIRYAQKLLPNSRFVLTDLTQSHDLIDPNETFYGKIQAGFCSEVLEHIENPILALKNIGMFLSSDNSLSRGTLVITVPGGPMTNFSRGLGHLRHFTKDSIAQLIEDADMEVIQAQLSHIENRARTLKNQ